MSSQNISLHLIRTVGRMLVMTLVASMVALLPPIPSARAEFSPLQRNVAIAKNVKSMDLAEAIDPATEFVPYRAAVRWTQRSDVWLKAPLPPRGFGVLYLDLNTNIAGNVPQGDTHVYVAGDDDPRTVLELRALRDGMYRLPALPAQGSVLVRTGGIPGIAFSPIIRDERTLSMWDFDGKLWLTAACAIIAVVLFLRAALERSEWRILAAILAMMSSTAIWFDAPVVRNGLLINPASLPAILAPGAILFLYPHIGRLALGLRERGGSVDAMFIASSFLSLPLFTLAVPPFAQFVPLIGLWPVAFIPFWILSVLALVRKIPGSGRYACMTTLMLVPQCAVISPFGVAGALTDLGLANSAFSLVKHLPASSLCLLCLLCLVISFPLRPNDTAAIRVTSRKRPEPTEAAPSGDVPVPSHAMPPATEAQKPFSLHLLVQSAMDAVQDAADTKNLVLAWHIAPQISSRYFGNQAALSSALLHLLASAIKATRQGQIQLRARRLPESNDPGQLLFSVTDTGVATMPERDATSLTKAWQWIATMNGAISMTSDPTGTTISFAVRFKPEKNETPSSDAPLAASFQTLIGDSPRVIITSSVPNNREMLAYYLDELHYDLREARSTTEALAMYSQTPGSLTIFNDDLAGQDVTHAIARIRDLEARNDYPMAAILVLVADETQSKEMLRAGCTCTLTAPVTLTMFRHTVLKLAPHAQGIQHRAEGPSASPFTGVRANPDRTPRRQDRDTAPMTQADAGQAPCPEEQDNQAGTMHDADIMPSDTSGPIPATESASGRDVPEDASSPSDPTTPTRTAGQDDVRPPDPAPSKQPETERMPSGIDASVSRTAISELAVAKATLSRTGTASHAVEEATSAGKRLFRISVRPGYVAQDKPAASASASVPKTDKDSRGLLSRLIGKARPEPAGITPDPEEPPVEWVGEPTPRIQETPHGMSPAGHPESGDERRS